MFSETKRRYLFKCEDCGTIIAFTFDEVDDEKEISDINENKMELECSYCTGKLLVLLD